MLLVNRAPIDDTGKLMVTTATPTSAWPVLGGMTYDPVSGALAVIDAVPAVNDPWNGGIRFTHLGAMYVITTLPTPLFYVGGIVVSADGRVYFSSGAPLYGVGGWPIAGDGGIAGSGLAPTASFFAPLMTTLVPTTAGNPTFTFARAALAYAMDFEGILRQSIANEARFQGARRVRNWVSTPENISAAGGWGVGNATTAIGATDPLGGATAWTLTATGANGNCFTNSVNIFTSSNTLVDSAWIRRRTGTGQIIFRRPNNTDVDITSQLTTSWQRFSASSIPHVTTTGYLFFGITVSGDAIDVWHPQIEDLSGASNQAPSEYVSNGVLAAPYHGCGVDGVKCFNYLNPNVVE